jgi:hypothetical protein
MTCFARLFMMETRHSVPRLLAASYQRVDVRDVLWKKHVGRLALADVVLLLSVSEVDA